MLKFKRLAQISSDPEIIGESLKHSKLMQVSEDGSKIRRNPEVPLPENSLEYWQVVKRRTVYIVSCFASLQQTTMIRIGVDFSFSCLFCGIS